MMKIIFSGLFFLSIASTLTSFANEIELSDIVVGVDLGESEEPEFPMHAYSGHGEIYLQPMFNLKFNLECSKEFIAVNQTDKTASCSPNGDSSKSFVFAQFSKKRKPQMESDSSWKIIYLDYDLKRVQLVAKKIPNSNELEYQLIIKDF